jgi:hypothetical protein
MIQAVLNIKNINQDLAHIIAESLKHSIKEQNWEPQPKHCQQYPCIAKQTTIGWQQIFLGRISTTLAQQLAAGDRNDNSRSTLAQSGMARYVIKTIWDTLLTLWKQRNEIIHGTQETTKAERQRQALIQRVQRCYDYQNQLRTSDQQKLFKLEYNEMILEDPQKIQAWTRVVESIIRTSKREQKPSTSLQGQLMENYFKWQPPDGKTKRVRSKQRQKQDLHPD